MLETPPMRRLLPCLALVACVPPGNSTPSDSGAPATSSTAQATTTRPSVNVLTTVFEDNFDRPKVTPAATAPTLAIAPSVLLGDAAAPKADAAGEAAVAIVPVPATAVALPADELGPNWRQAQTNAWRIENGRLCGQNAKNHGVWLQKVLPVNARIEFDAVGDSQDVDLKAELWGDGQSAATGQSYTNATSYLTIFGGWHNKYHVLARINEHGTDRKEIEIDPKSDDPRERPAVKGQQYHFKIERTDGKTVRWFVDGLEWLKFADAEPLAGFGHDHFGFNDWEVKVCFDNVRVTPLP